MTEIHGKLLAGTILNQVVLIRLLESKGFLERGETSAALREYISSVSDQSDDIYAPMRQLIGHLDSTDFDNTATRQ